MPQYLSHAIPSACGLGLAWTWKTALATYVIEPSYAVSVSQPIAQCLPYLGPMLACLLVISSSTLKRSAQEGAFGLVTGMAAGILSLLLLGAGPVLPAVLFSILEIFAFGTGTLLIACWGCRLVSNSSEQSIIELVLSFLLSNVAYAALSPLLPGIIIPLLTALPIVSAFVFVASSRQEGSRGAGPLDMDIRREMVNVAPSALKRSDFLPLALLVILIGIEELLRAILTSLFSGGAESIGLFTQMTQVGSLIMFAAICGFAMLRRPNISTAGLAVVLLPILTIGYLSLLLFGRSNASICYVVLGAGYWCLYSLAWLFALDLAKRTGLSLFVFTCTEGGVSLIALVTLIISSATGAGLDALIPASCAFILTAVLTFMLLLSNQGIMRSTSPERLETSSPTEQPSSNPAATRTDPIKCLCQSHGLSPRESEVFELLARGRSIPYIQNFLGIASGTAQAHTRHIYEKLGVHSRQELLDLIDKEAQTAKPNNSR